MAMTEAEWLACTKRPDRMLGVCRSKASDRKLRLFACACARRFWSSLSDDRSRAALVASERFADGQSTFEELGRLHAAAHGVGASAGLLAFVASMPDAHAA